MKHRRNPETDPPDTEYCRVLPRDLFNEAKLLKCVGRLTLLIHDGLTPCNLTFEHEGEPFKIGLMEDGHLTITNIYFKVKGQPVTMRTPYNSKGQYPLSCYRENVDLEVFDNSGELTQEFLTMCK